MDTNRPEIVNNKEEVPLSYYVTQIEASDPHEISARLGIPFDPVKKEFCVALLGKDYHICVSDYAISSDSDEAYAIKSLPAQSFILRYLLEGQVFPFSGKYMSFQELPWGDVYIKPFTGRVIDRLRFSYGTRPEIFASVLESMGAIKVNGADMAYEICVIGDFRIRLLLWQGDEEFAPSCQVLFSDNFTGLSAEDHVVACDIIINSMRHTESKTK